MKDDFGLKQMKVDIPELGNFDWLSNEEFAIVRSTLETVNIQDVLEDKILSTNALNMLGYFENAEIVGVTLQNIKFNANTRIEIVSVPNDISLFGVKAFNLQEEEGKHYLRIVSNLGGEIIADIKEYYAGNVLENPNLFEVYNDLVSGGEANNQGQVSTNAWYSNLPCVGNGCCVIKEPVTPGGIPTLPIVYNWCGAGCGSGPYVNSVDLCCRAHDLCYGRVNSYPGRCNCDRNLLSCLSGNGLRAASLISAAFRLKMLAQKC